MVFFSKIVWLIDACLSAINDVVHYYLGGEMTNDNLSEQPKDDSEANGSEPSTLSSPVSGGGHHGEPASRETTDTEAAGQWRLELDSNPRSTR